MPPQLAKRAVAVRLCALIIAALACTSASAQYLFLNRSMLEVLTKQDITMLQSALEQALSSEPDGTVVTWANPGTGASGTVTPLSTTKSAGRTCRRVETFTQARNRRESGQWEFCKLGAKWALK